MNVYPAKNARRQDVNTNADYTYKPVRFFFTSYALTWAAWLGAAYFSYHQAEEPSALISVFEMAGIFSPFIASLWFIFSSGSRQLKQDYCRKLFDLRSIRIFSIFVILLILPIVDYISIFTSHLFFGKPMSQLAFADLSMFTAGPLTFPVIIFGAALLEELGWKGYGVDSLRGERSFFTVTLIYALLWALWHTPLFFINGYYHNLILRENPLFALNFYLSVFPMAFLINWLWFKNKGNILTAVLLHAMANAQGRIQMGQVAKCVQTVVLIVVVAVIVWLDRETFFKKFPQKIGWYGA